MEIMLERHDISGIRGMVFPGETACFSGLMAHYLAIALSHAFHAV